MKYFSTLLPPPNLTGILHLGHAWNAILQDVLMRFHELRGIPTYWGYGLDHAGISLQIKVEESLRAGGIDPRSLHPDEFAQHLWGWKERHAEIIRSQYGRLNLSLPLGDERFTLDEGSRAVVRDVFARLFNDGLIYRARRLVNWDSGLNTVVSDSEIEYRESVVPLYHISYPLEGSDGHIVVATTRPETIFGDVAIFINPGDVRYGNMVGRHALVPLINRRIPIIADEYVDMEFGTGAMKCTPAHDFADWELGRKYSLGAPESFDKDGVYLIGPYAGRSRFDTLGQLISDLGATSCDYKTSLSYSSRGGGMVEPLMSEQWFLRSSELARRALEFWRDNGDQLEVPHGVSREALVRCLEGMSDWCISRQLSWGIGIPIWERDGQYSLVEREGFNSSPDVLDTWFSSSLWPIIVLGNTGFMPISTLISGRDILLFWISRMLFMCLYVTGQLPFRRIYLHGLVLDSRRRKMSKSLGNGVDPTELIGEFGLDVVRLFFIFNTHGDRNIAFSKGKLNYFERFLWKMKNALSFIGMQGVDLGNTRVEVSSLNLIEGDMLRRLYEVKSRVEIDYGNLNFHYLCERVINFAWDDFCNRYLEAYKLMRGDGPIGNSANFLSHLWAGVRNLLYPLIPNFTGDVAGSGIPEAVDASGFPDIGWFHDLLNATSSVRARLRVGGVIRVNLILGESVRERVLGGPGMPMLSYLYLARCELADVRDTLSPGGNLILNLGPLYVELLLPSDKIDEYLIYIAEARAKAESEIAFLTGRLNSGDFATRAPQSLVEETREKIRRYQGELDFYRKIYGG